jgi:beta-lactamase regulating signal transducer with metallopeptidase domain
MNMLLRMYPGDVWAYDIGVVLVQIMVIGVLGGLMASVGRRHGAAFCHGVWFCVLIGILVSPLLTFALHSMGISFITIDHWSRSGPTQKQVLSRSRSTTVSGNYREGAIASRTTMPSELTDMPAKLPARETPTLSPPDYLRACGGVATTAWLIGVFYFLLQGLHGSWITSSFCRSARAWENDDRDRIFDDIRNALGRASLPQIACSDTIDGPLVVGIFRPLILLPASMENGADPESVRDVLIHECAHVVRRDSIVGLFQRLAEVLFWPHPVVHYVNQKLGRTREEVCDNFVLRRGNPTRYAQTLFELAQHVSSGYREPAAFGLFTPRWRLEDRIAGLLDSRRRTMTRMNRLVVAGLIALSVSTAVVIAGVGTEDQLGELLQQRLETAKRNVEATEAAYVTGICSLSELLGAEKALRDVQLDTAATAAERIVVLEDHLKTIGDLEQQIENRYRLAERGGEAERFYRVKLERESAQIDLLREKFLAK